MINLYKISSVLLIPLIVLNIHWRIFRNKEDKIRYKERYGIASRKKNEQKEVIWIHAASVGEFKSTDFIIQNYFKNYFILITTTTKSAAEYVEDNYSDKVTHQYAPLDISIWVLRFLNYWKPKLVLWIESDLWPNTINILKKNNIKSIYLNARISPKSFSRWMIAKSLYQSLMKTFEYIFAQSLDDKKRIELLSKLKIEFIGNLKLTNNIKKEFQNKISKKLSIMIASTHKNEEELIISQLLSMMKLKKNIRFYFAPRHPERAINILKIFKENKLEAKLENENQSIKSNILIINSFGKMEQFYNISDIVILGGSFVNKGGHNPIEPAKYNCVVLSGKNIFNWNNVYKDMYNNNACLILNSHIELLDNINRLVNSQPLIEKYKINALNFATRNFFDEKKLKAILNESLK